MSEPRRGTLASVADVTIVRTSAGGPARAPCRSWQSGQRGYRSGAAASSLAAAATWRPIIAGGFGTRTPAQAGPWVGLGLMVTGRTFGPAGWHSRPQSGIRTSPQDRHARQPPWRHHVQNSSATGAIAETARDHADSAQTGASWQDHPPEIVAARVWHDTCYATTWGSAPRDRSLRPVSRPLLRCGPPPATRTGGMLGRFTPTSRAGRRPRQRAPRAGRV
jgi:hypothetical protein